MQKLQFIDTKGVYRHLAHQYYFKLLRHVVSSYSFSVTFGVHCAINNSFSFICLGGRLSRGKIRNDRLSDEAPDKPGETSEKFRARLDWKGQEGWGGLMPPLFRVNSR